MKQGSVKKRIFISNAFMVLVSLLVFLAINLVIIKGYSEAIEKEIRTSVEQIVDEDGLEDLIIDWTFQRNEFLLFFGLDGILCFSDHQPDIYQKSYQSYYGAAGCPVGRCEKNQGK